MDWKIKAFAICFVLMAFATASIAMTFTNKEDALGELGKADPQTFAEGNCKVYSVTETINLGEQSGGIRADYVFTYTIEGNIIDDYGYVIVPNANQKEIEDAVAAKCDETWAGLKVEAQNRTITSVYINYTKGALSGLLNKVYDLETRKWS